jgi:hypothetical protein
MGARLQGDFYDIDATKYRVTLDVDGYAGSTSDFDISEMKLVYKGDTNDIHAPILTSSVSLSFLIPNGTIAAIFTGLVGAAEESYRLKIEKGVGNDLFWAGFVIPDQVVIQDKPYPYEFSITAVDGITRLKDKEYTGTGTNWEDEDKISQHLYNVLSFIPVADYWGASDAYLKSHIQLFATNQTAGVAVSPLPTTRVNHRVFRSVDKKGKVKRKTAYEVLVELCTMFGARFYLSNGAYYFEQVTRYAAEDTNLTIKVFDKTLGVLTDEVLNDWAGRVLEVDRSSVRLAAGADLTVVSGAVNTYMSAASKVEVSYKHFQTRSIFSHLFPVPIWNQDESLPINTGPVDDNSTSTRMLLNADISYTLSFPDPEDIEPGYVKMTCTISIVGDTTYYLKRVASLEFGVPIYQEMEWVTSANTYQFYTEAHNGTSGTFLHSLSLYTPNFPGSGDLSVGFDVVEVTGYTGPVFGGGVYDLLWSVSNAYGEVFSDGTVDAPSVYTDFYSYNDDDTNSDVIEIETILGDGPTGSAFGRIQILNGSDWEDSAGWRRYPASAYLPHGARIAQEIITPRLKPSERIEGTMRGGFMAHQMIQRSETRYIFLGGAIDLSRNTVDGTWVFITDVSTLATTPETGVDVFLGNPDPAAPSGPPTLVYPPVGWIGDTIRPAIDTVGLNSGVIFTTQFLIEQGDSTGFLFVDEREVIHPFFNGDPVMVINPFTAQSQEFEVSETNETDKTITVTTEAADFDFPKRSFVTPGLNFNHRLLTKLRRLTKDFQLVPYFLDVPIDLVPVQFDAFYRVPSDFAGYRVAKLIVSTHTAGDAGANFAVRVTKTGGIFQDVTIPFDSTKVEATLSTYWALADGDLIEFFIQSTTATTQTRPKGLTIELQIIATL